MKNANPLPENYCQAVELFSETNSKAPNHSQASFIKTGTLSG
jgi:hypothetical protein